MGSLLARRIDESIEAGVARGRTEGLERGLEQGVARGLEQGLEQGVARGLEQGLERGLEQERAMLARQAGRKFGAETGARLAELLAGVADAERLARIGDLVIDCADGAELLARAEETARTA